MEQLTFDSFFCRLTSGVSAREISGKKSENKDTDYLEFRQKYFGVIGPFLLFVCFL